MTTPRIALNARPTQFKKLIDLGNRIDAGISGNASYATPSPTLIILRAAVSDTTEAYNKAGTKKDHGSSADHVDLVTKALNLFWIIKQLGSYVTNTAAQTAGTDFATMRSILSTSGFELAKEKGTHNLLECVQNFRNFISRSLKSNQVKLKWKRPLNTTRPKDVSNYEIYRGTTNVFSAATIIGNTTKCEWVDTNTTGVPQPSWYYWVVACNPAGSSVPSAALCLTVGTI